MTHHRSKFLRMMHDGQEVNPLTRIRLLEHQASILAPMPFVHLRSALTFGEGNS